MTHPEMVLENTATSEDTLRHALREIRRLRSELAMERLPARSSTAPVTVIGAGCRLPGGIDSLDRYWEALVDGRCVVADGPPDRWQSDAYFSPHPGTPGRSYTTAGGFLDDITEFDADLFRIPPREAIEIDPQHRLLLEVAWEALEHAGIAPDTLKGTSTGVYVGISGSDYERLRLGEGDPNASNVHSATGTATNFAANRLSYSLDLRGPSLVVDTACSSSLVAVHLAMNALRNGDCDTAIVGGVNLMASSSTTVALCQGRMLSPSGRCHTFDDRADGYARGEGCAVVILRRSADVDPDANRPLGNLLGSAMNQDGGSSGITVPNGASQQTVITSAMNAARISPNAVGYVEAHGTGTALGDPIEVQALASVFGDDRGDNEPLVLGSVKANIGHLEAAAGVAGLLKTLLVTKNGVIPAHPDLRIPNRRIPWDSLPVTVNQSAIAWPDATRVAGVSAFGFGGTNCHVVVGNERRIGSETASENRSIVVESSSTDQVADAPDSPDDRTESVPHMIKVSGATRRSLEINAARLADALEAGPVDLELFSRAACVGRADLEHRAIAVGSDRATLVSQLRDIATGGGRRGRRVGGLDPSVSFHFHQLDSGDNRTPVAFADVPNADDVLAHLDGLDVASAPQDSITACALSMWWKSVGLRPEIVEAQGRDGYLAAAVAGVLSTKRGLELTVDDGGDAEQPIDDADVGSAEAQVVWAESLGTCTRLRTLMAAANATSTVDADCDVRLDLLVGDGRSVALHLIEGVVAYWLAGGSVEWARCFPLASGFVELPTYAWDRVPLWYRDLSTEAGLQAVGLDVQVTANADGGATGRAMVNLSRCPVVAEHTVYGLSVVPGVVYLETLLRTAEQRFDQEVTPSRLRIERPVVLREGGGVELSVELGPKEDGRSMARVVSADTDGRRRVHLEAELVYGGDLSPPTVETSAEGGGGDSAGPEVEVPIPDPVFYRDGWHPQFTLGPSFTLVTEATAVDGTITGRLVLPDSRCAGTRSGVRSELLVLDACVQLAGSLIGTADASGPVHLGTGFTRFERSTARLPDVMIATAELSPSGTDCDIRIESESGEYLATLFGIGYGPVDESTLRRLADVRPGVRREQLPVDPKQRVAYIIASVLGTTVEKLSDDEPLSDMMDSLMFVEVAEGLSEAFERPIAEADLLDAVSIAGVVRLVGGESAAPRAGERRRRRTMDVSAMAAEAEVDLVVTPPEPAGQAPADILLTGATGFVGAFLLNELLSATTANVTCLVRAEDQEHGIRRLLESTSSFGVHLADYRNRIDVVVGDLSLPRFGLDSDSFEALHARIGQIFHNGAEVKWTSNYKRLAPTNVCGTRHVLELATVGPARPVHLTSTVGVFSSGDVIHDKVSEQTDMMESGPLAVGYAQTKWVAERMVRNAGELGLPVTIHRINTAPHSETGAFNRLDHLSLILKGCIEAGIAPTSGRFPLQAAPIDYVAAAMVHLAIGGEFYGETSHLVNNPPMEWSEMFKHIEDFGYCFRHLPFDEWRHQVTNRSSGTMALLGLAPFMNDMIDDVHLAVFDSSLTDSRLSTLPMSCPVLDGPLIHTFLEGFLAREFVVQKPQRDEERVLSEGKV